MAFKPRKVSQTLQSFLNYQFPEKDEDGLHMVEYLMIGYDLKPLVDEFEATGLPIEERYQWLRDRFQETTTDYTYEGMWHTNEAAAEYVMKFNAVAVRRQFGNNINKFKEYVNIYVGNRCVFMKNAHKIIEDYFNAVN